MRRIQLFAISSESFRPRIVFGVRFGWEFKESWIKIKNIRASTEITGSYKKENYRQSYLHRDREVFLHFCPSKEPTFLHLYYLPWKVLPVHKKMIILAIVC